MALPKLDQIEIQFLDQWFNNLVDNLNYDIGQIQTAISMVDPMFDNVLTTIDTAPIAYLRDSLKELVESINEGFSQIEQRLKALEQGG